VVALVTVLAAVLIVESKMSRGYHLAYAAMFVTLLAHALMLILPATVSQATRAALARKTR
jgi:hypothetical protein